MKNSLSVDEAGAISRSSPALGLFSAGEKLRFLLSVGAPPGNTWYVDGDNGSDTAYDGSSWGTPFKTIGAAVAAASGGDCIMIKPRATTPLAVDPVSYAETIIIPNTKPGLSLIGYNTGRTQGGLPQIKINAGTTPMLTIRAPGCLIAGLGFNGINSLGGGILLDDDGGTTKTAFGTTIMGCHFKNCAGHATNGTLGGAIMFAFSVSGSPWQVLIKGNRFWKNLSDIVMMSLGTGTQLQDLVIEDNIFGGPPSAVDVNLWLGGAGVLGLVIRRNHFDALPAQAGGTVGKYMILQGSTGILHENFFGCVNTLTFKAASAGSAAWVPATVLMAGNWGENCTTPFVHTA